MSQHFLALLCHYGKRHCQFSHKKPTFFQYCCAFKLSLLLKSSCCSYSFRKENNFESQSNLLWGRNMDLQHYTKYTRQKTQWRFSVLPITIDGRLKYENPCLHLNKGPWQRTEGCKHVPPHSKKEPSSKTYHGKE